MAVFDVVRIDKTAELVSKRDGQRLRKGQMAESRQDQDGYSQANKDSSFHLSISAKKRFTRDKSPK